MKLLLHGDIPKLGYFGDVVEVKDGYARNYLIPQGLAVTPTEANIKAIEEERAQKAEIRRLAMEQLKKVADKVDGTTITIQALANDMGHLFGSVTEQDVATALVEAGHEIQVKYVQLGEHLRMIGSREVTLKLSEEISATITVNVVRPEDKTDESESTESTTDDAEATEATE